MLFDYAFLFVHFFEWVTLVLLFSGFNIFVQADDSHASFFKTLLRKTVLFALLLIVVAKILLVLLLIWPLQDKQISSLFLPPLTVFILWQLIFAFIFLYYTAILIFKPSFNERLQTSFGKKAFVGIVFTGIWDLLGSVVVYLFYLNALLQSKLVPGNLTITYTTPQRQWLVAAAVFLLLAVLLFVNRRLRKKQARRVLQIYVYLYILMLALCLFVWLYYAPLTIPTFAHLFNYFYLYLAVVLSLVLFFFSVLALLLLLKFFKHQSGMNNRFYLQYLTYHLLQIHGLTMFGLVIVSTVPFFFFIYY